MVELTSNLDYRLSDLKVMMANLKDDVDIYYQYSSQTHSYFQIS